MKTNLQKINRFGLRFKFIAWFSILVVVMIAVLGSFYYLSIRKNIFELYSKKTQYATQLAAKEIDGDKALQYLQQGHIADDFQATDKKIRYIKQLFNLKYLYMFKPEKDYLSYIYAAYNPGDDQYSRVETGQRDSYIGGNSKIMAVMQSGKASQNLDITLDEKYGYLASAYAPVFDSQGRPVAIMAADCSMQQILDNIRHDVYRAVGIIILIIGILIALYCWFLDKKVVLPLKKLTANAGKIVEKCEAGTLIDYEQEFAKTASARRDEIKDLEQSFYHMTLDLQNYIKNLERVTNEKQKIETELNVAKSIQSMLLPKIFPPFKETDNFAIYATVEPAKSVGGDYYDFYMVDDDHICFTIADVSGKGVPAALFMVIAKTIMKNQAMQCFQPAEVLAQTNDQLSADNEEGMFVTAFFAVFEISTGRLLYANAGHNPPLLYRRDGSFEYLEMENNVILAAMPGMNYTQQELVLHDGDILFTYTDGVTEAMNEQGEVYSEPKLRDTLNSVKDKSAALSELLQHVRSSISSHVQQAEQSDDITMLLFRKG